MTNADHGRLPRSASSQLATRHDAIGMYNFFLRRDPESEVVINGNIGQAISRIFPNFISSPEFSDRVVKPMASQGIPNIYTGSTSFPELLSWAVNKIPFSAKTRERLAVADSWEAVDLALLQDEAVAERVFTLRDPIVRRAIELRALLARFENNDQPAINLRRKMPRSEIQLAESILSGLAWSPRFGILIGVDHDNCQLLDATLDSLKHQVYTSWRAVIVCKDRRARKNLSVRPATNYSDLGERVTISAEGEVGRGFADVIGGTCDDAQCDLIGIISAGDVLGCDALLRMAMSTGLQPGAEFFYSDERRINPINGKVEAFLKPQWSPDLLLATNYIGRFWCAKVGLINRVAGDLKDWSRRGEYDLVLRCTEAAHHVEHVAHVLCERGRPEIDAPARERSALARAMKRRNTNAEITEGCAAGYHRLRRRSQFQGMVSIIIPSGGNVDLLSKCLFGLLMKTRYQNFELIILHNTNGKADVFPYDQNTGRDPRLRTIDARGSFNFSRICNLGAASAQGELLLFLNDDIEVVDPDWLDALIEQAVRPEVGIVGARLLYPNGTLEHAGIFWVAGAGHGRHSFRALSGSDPGYFGLAATQRNVLAVTGACLMMRRSWFEALGGFDEAHTIINNDVDICLRSWSKGGRVVYEPAAELIHHERSTRHSLPDDYDVEKFSKKWGVLLGGGDPYYHPRLSRERDDYAFDEEATRVICAGYPLFRREDIRRIAVLKLDHIGDFIACVPALRRLHDHFPLADLYLVAPPPNAALAKAFLPGIRQVINFEFFHANSGLGNRDLSADDLVALQGQLAPYGFDLAVDMRKHLDTRHVLRFTGARWLAGYDCDHKFPWLDIALEWEGDGKTIHKRAHISADLCRLVDAIALAATPGRSALSLPARSGDHLAGIAQTGKPLVCIHPGAGTETKQWPTKHFAALIDLLHMNHAVEVILIGSADEAAIADEVLSSVSHIGAVRSVVGAIEFTDLPILLASAVLFVGNDSGPKHIAAGLGVPTVGIHSGFVDASEWGPIGPNAVAVKRDMRCSPCYLPKAELCPRQLACLNDLVPSSVYELCKQMLLIEYPLVVTAEPRRGYVGGDGAVTEAMGHTGTILISRPAFGDGAELSTEAILASVKDIFRQTFENDNVSLRPEFKEQDSSQRVEILMAVEERFGFKLNSSEIDGMECVDDLVRLIRNRRNLER